MDNYNEALQFAKTFWSEQVQAETENNILFQDVVASIPSEADLERMGDALEQAARDPDTNDFDVLVMIAAGLMRENERLPDWLASFAADVLEGKRKRPTKRGADKYKNWPRDYSLWRAVDEVAKTRHEIPPPVHLQASHPASHRTDGRKFAVSPGRRSRGRSAQPIDHLR